MKVNEIEINNIGFSGYKNLVSAQQLRNDMLPVIRNNVSHTYMQDREYNRTTMKMFYDMFYNQFLNKLEELGNLDYADILVKYKDKVLSVILRSKDKSNFQEGSINLNDDSWFTKYYGGWQNIKRNVFAATTNFINQHTEKGVIYEVTQNDTLSKMEYTSDHKLKRLSVGDHVLEFDTTKETNDKYPKTKRFLSKYYYKGQEASPSDWPVEWYINGSTYRTNLTGDADLQYYFKALNIDNSPSGYAKKQLEEREKKIHDYMNKYDISLSEAETMVFNEETEFYKRFYCEQ